MVHIGIDVYQESSVFNVFDPAEGEGGTHRAQKVETTAAGFRRVLAPLAGRCAVAFEVGPMTQWIAALELERILAARIARLLEELEFWLRQVVSTNGSLAVRTPLDTQTLMEAATVRERLRNNRLLTRAARFGLPRTGVLG